MNENKLMPMLFYDGNFNRDGRRMRAILEREITDGITTYRIWRSAGKPDLDYSRAENDKYLLYAEINGRLAPLRLTDYQLIDDCGFRPAAEKLYGGPDHRSAYFDEYRKQSLTGAASISDLMDREKAEIHAFGSDPARQTAYLKAMLDEHVSTYQKARENGGETFPDFIGALILNELDACCSLSVVHRKLREEQARERRVREEVENKAYCAEKSAGGKSRCGRDPNHP